MPFLPIEPQWLVMLRQQHDDLRSVKAAAEKAREWNEEAEILRAKIRELGAVPVA